MDNFVKINTCREKKSDPYNNVRREIPKPGYIIATDKEYYRPKKRRMIENEIEEWQEEIEQLGVKIL